jgi:hypothetical protein
MASSTPPSTLRLDDDDAWQGFASGFSSSLSLVLAPAPSLRSDASAVVSPSAVPSSTSSGSSGKFNAFTFVGASVSGGAVKRFLVHLCGAEEHEEVCFGLVGSTKFCLRDKIPGSTSCGTGRHGLMKFPVTGNALYVKFTDTQIYTQPVLDAEVLSEEQIEVLLTKNFTLSEWSQLFQDIEDQTFPDWLSQAVPPAKAASAIEPMLRPLSILSPTHDEASHCVFQQVMSFDSSDSTMLMLPENKTWRAEVVPTDCLTYVESVNSKLSRFKSTLAKPFRDIESSYRLLVADLKTIHCNVAQLHNYVGSPVSLKGLDFNSVWEAVDVLGKAVIDLESNNELLDELIQQKVEECLASESLFQQTTASIVSMTQRLQQIEQNYGAMERMLNVHSDRFRTVRAFMQHQQETQPPDRQ